MMKEETPRANRFHIGLFGRRNSGKSSLVNMLTGQQVAVVSDVPGTTTDVVLKNIELPGVGASVLVDTAGYDDEGELGGLRVRQTVNAARRVDLALIIVSGLPDGAEKEKAWAERFRADDIPVLYIYNKVDEDGGSHADAWRMTLGATEVVSVSARTGEGRDRLLSAMAEVYRRTDEVEELTGNLAGEGDTVVLVMPQDIQAPKGRLILPQVQTTRELLDKKCLIMSVTTDKFVAALKQLVQPPKLIITDSQVFSYVYENKPKESMLTSFSVLFAAYKGDLPYYVEGAKQIDSLTEQSHVLIAECCTHAPLQEDIGRVKIPRMLKKRFGEGITVDHVSGMDFPQDLRGYDLIIQCGACMFNRKYVLSRIDHAKEQQVPMTNYGVTIAHLTGILPHVVMP
mgnify:CR=1 FL=1